MVWVDDDDGASRLRLVASPESDVPWMSEPATFKMFGVLCNVSFTDLTDLGHLRLEEGTAVLGLTGEAGPNAQGVALGVACYMVPFVRRTRGAEQRLRLDVNGQPLLHFGPLQHVCHFSPIHPQHH